jgi:hypothetical protein
MAPDKKLLDLMLVVSAVLLGDTRSLKPSNATLTDNGPGEILFARGVATAENKVAHRANQSGGSCAETGHFIALDAVVSAQAANGAEKRIQVVQQ